MSEPSDFDELAREFQRVDTDARERELVASRFLRARHKSRRQMAVGVAIGIGLASIALHKLWLERDAPAVAFAIIEIGVPVVLLSARWRERRKVWAATTETVRGYLELEIARTSADIRLGRFLVRLMPLLVLGILIFQLLVLRKVGFPSGAPAAAAMGFGGPYVILAGVLWFNRRKRARLERERAALEAERRRLTEEDAAE